MLSDKDRRGEFVKGREVESVNLPPFTRSAQKALRWLAVVLKQAEWRITSRTGPDLRAILDQCQEAGCELPELEHYHSEQTASPALTLFGGDLHLAERLARALSLTATFPEMTPSTLVWEVKSGPYEACTLCYGTSKRRISMSALATFLKKSITADNIVWIRQTTQGAADAKWRFIWVPWPDKLETLWKSPESIGIFARQHGAVIVLDDTPPELVTDLRELGQRRWEIPRADLQLSEMVARLESEVSALLETTPSQQAAREAAIWQWLRNRCQGLLVNQRNELQKTLDQQLGRLKRVEQLLAHYRQNWLHGFRNQVEGHFHHQRNAPGVQKLFKGKDVQVRSFLEAVALGTLRSNLEHFADERLAEFVMGLGALALKLDLARLQLNESHTPWRADNLAAKLETILTERDTFPPRGKGSHLVKKIAGRLKNQEEERYHQIEAAIELTSGLIATSWSDWCTDFFVGIKRHIGQTIDASLIAAGHPTLVQLKERTMRIDAIIKSLHAEQTPRAALVRNSAKHLLETFARWQSPKPIPT